MTVSDIPVAHAQAYWMLYHKMAHGLALAELVRDAAGRAIDHRLLAANPAFEKQFGIPSALADGRLVSSWLPDLEPEWLEIFDRVVTTGELEGFERYFDAQDRWYQICVYPGGGDRFTVLYDDITSRKAAAEALRESDKSKVRFVAALGHELRNALAPLSASAQLLRRPHDEERRERMVSVMERQIRHMQGLLDDLLDVARNRAGKIALNLEVIELQELVRSAVEDCAADMQQRNHEVQVLGPSEPLRVAGDRVRLMQVLSNLLRNACKYTPPGGTIRVCVHLLDGDAVVEVADSGMGISAQDLPRVFDLFTQAADHGAHAAGGIGVGLFLVRELVQMHGGEVRAFSDGLGHGSRFVVSLPLAPCDA